MEPLSLFAEIEYEYPCQNNQKNMLVRNEDLETGPRKAQCLVKVVLSNRQTVIRSHSHTVKLPKRMAKADGEKRRDLCERTFQFALRIVNLCQELSKNPGVARTMANQLLRSGTSVGANVEEGLAPLNSLR